MLPTPGVRREWRISTVDQWGCFCMRQVEVRPLLTRISSLTTYGSPDYPELQPWTQNPSDRKVRVGTPLHRQLVEDRLGADWWKLGWPVDSLRWGARIEMATLSGREPFNREISVLREQDMVNTKAAVSKLGFSSGQS